MGEETIKREFDLLRKDLERIMHENYELSKKFEKLESRFNEHIKTCGVLTH